MAWCGAVLALLPWTSQASSWQPALPPSPPPIPFSAPALVERSEFFDRYEVSFPSALLSGFEENDQVRADYYLPTERIGRAPVMILLHFWGATDQRIERRMAEQFAFQGVASLVIQLPYHLNRAPAGTRSGELAITPDPDALVDTMRQSLADVQRGLDWVASRPELNPERVGIVGTSLGSIVGALAFAVDERFQHGAFVLGGIDLAEILWTSSIVVEVRDQLRRAGWTEERLRERLVSVDPGTYFTGAETRPTLVVAARFDTVIPPVNADKLIEALGDPQVVWLDTGHYGGALAERQIVRAVTTFSIGTLLDRPFDLPGRFDAPTLRLGLNFNPEQSAQVFLGIDLWRNNDRGDLFGTALITPQGFGGFVGARLSQNLAGGLMILPQRTTWGVMWSVVL